MCLKRLEFENIVAFVDSFIDFSILLSSGWSFAIGNIFRELSSLSRSLLAFFLELSIEALTKD